MAEETKPATGAEEEGSWFEEGYDGMLPPPDTSNRVLRYWMPKGTDKVIIFLTGVPVLYFEHAVYLNGNWRNYFTCVAPMGKKCPLCELMGRKKDSIQRYQAGAYSIIDTSEYKDRSGTMRKNVKKLYVAKGPVMERLKKRHEKAKKEHPDGLKGLAVTVSRGSSKISPAVGEDFEVEARIDFSTLTGVDVAPHNFREILKPDIEAMIRTAKILGGGSDKAGSSGEVDY